MAFAISGSVASLFSASAAAGASRGQTAPKPQLVTTNNNDTAHLTQGERVQQLYIQGHSVPQIASSLDLTAKAVDTYLGIQNAKS